MPTKRLLESLESLASLAAVATLAAASPAAASPAAADDRSATAPAAPVAAHADSPSPVMAALFHIAGESFTPPADNRALQDLLARHPALSFLEACGVGDTAEIQRQLARDPKLATTWTSFGWSALHLAAFSGVPGAVQQLLDRGAEINARARSKFKNTPLQAALLPGQLATAKLLLDRGADPLIRQAHGISPLHEAALLGRRDLIDLLLSAGAEIDARADDGRTAETEALRGKHADLAAYLRSRGAHGAAITADLQAPPRD